MLDGKKEILTMFKNKNDGLTFEEIHTNKKFQPEVYFKNGTLTKINIFLVGALNQMVNSGILVWRQGKYYLKENDIS